eukprot:3225648-Pyramimonas_sp.AAC.1
MCQTSATSGGEDAPAKGAKSTGCSLDPKWPRTARGSGRVEEEHDEKVLITLVVLRSCSLLKICQTCSSSLVCRCHPLVMPRTPHWLTGSTNR